MAVLERVRTGVVGFDEITGGGFAKNSVVLLAGNPGSGKTTFGAEFILNGIRFGEPGVYVSFIELKDEFLRNMRNIGLNFDGLEEAGMFRFIEGLNLRSEKAIEAVISQVLDAVTRIKARRIVFDSITAITSILGRREIRGFLHSVLTRIIKVNDLTALLIAEVPFGAEQVGWGVEEFIVDAVIMLKVIPTETGLIKRVLRIEKMRGVNVEHASYEFIISKGGIRVYVPPDLSMVGAVEDERLKTGVGELDKMLNGGLKRGSVTLVAGPSGTGKSLLAMQFCISGASRGEKAVFLSYEEPACQVESLIREFKRGVEGEVHVISVSPRRMTPGAHFDMFRRLFDEEKPSRLVVDGLTTLEKAYSEAEFFEMIRGLTILSKANKTTTMLTIAKDIVKEEVPIATIVDNIIALWFEVEENTVKRKITVLKERRSPHGVEIKELNFEDGRIWVYG
nr:gas vesicle protein GvpD [Candidatus Freyrarchaeum guaymaensis]